MKFTFLTILSILLLSACQVDSKSEDHEVQTKEKLTIPKSNDNPSTDKKENLPKEIAPIKVEESVSEDRNNATQNTTRPKSGSGIITLAPSAMIEIDKFNEAYLISLVRKGINLIRIRRGASQLKLNEVLNQAAEDHNLYQIRKNELTHKQSKPRKHEVMDRVKTYGGGFRMVGENVQYQGLQQLTTGNRTEIISETYQQMANKMIKNWVDSPGHYDNLIESEFTEDGMAIGWNPENYAFFATHVFGARK